MEMQEIATEPERKKEDESAASESVLEVKTKEEAEPDHYSKLLSPSDNVYSETYYSGAPVKTTAGQQTDGNNRRYRAACLFLTIFCLVLLLVIIILSVKLQTGSSACAEKKDSAEADSPSIAGTCSFQQCQTNFPNVQSRHHGCKHCADGWLTFGRSCFYLSTFRLSWDQSQQNCTSRGGSLAVITSRPVQDFLSKEGKLKYWIGLRHKGATWKWVDNTVLRESYWSEVPQQGDCGILSNGISPERNWMKATCDAYTYFICQLQLQL
ncbi:C-type lectin domain family 9 member A isoform X2 [Embiotoca jacksoni]|uniref:C-type lectin domain family 9 member A isoform X2 n=1 Tax=Embiotoca jacksoni TaxID=100190 RepID=UPI0037043431